MPDIPMPTRAQKRAHWQELPWADYGERIFLLLLFGWFVSRVAPSVVNHPYNSLILASESFTAILVMVRRPGPMSVSLYAWLIAIAGTCMPLLRLSRAGGRLAPAGNPGIDDALRPVPQPRRQGLPAPQLRHRRRQPQGAARRSLPDRAPPDVCGLCHHADRASSC